MSKLTANRRQKETHQELNNYRRYLWDHDIPACSISDQLFWLLASNSFLWCCALCPLWIVQLKSPFQAFGDQACLCVDRTPWCHRVGKSAGRSSVARGTAMSSRSAAKRGVGAGHCTGSVPLRLRQWRAQRSPQDSEACASFPLPLAWPTL